MKYIGLFIAMYIAIGFCLNTLIYMHVLDERGVSFKQFCKDLAAWPWYVYKHFIRW